MIKSGNPFMKHKFGILEHFKQKRKISFALCQIFSLMFFMMLPRCISTDKYTRMQQSGEGINQIKPLDEDIQFKFICLIDGFHRVYFQLLKPKWPLVDIEYFTDAIEDNN